MLLKVVSNVNIRKPVIQAEMRPERFEIIG